MVTRTKILCLLIFILISRPGFSDDSGQFVHIVGALQYWLKEKPLIETETLLDSRFENYYYATAISLDSILSHPDCDWRVYRVARFHPVSGDEMSPAYRTLNISHKKQKQILVAGVYFLYRGNMSTGDRLAIELDDNYKYLPSDEKILLQDVIKIYYPKKQELAFQNFRTLLDPYVGEKNVYRNGILEFVADDFSPYYKTFKLRFMENVGSLSLTWNELILPDLLRRQSFEFSEGFLGLVDEIMKFGFSPKKGILLAGPPGTGKTLVGQILMSSILNGTLKATFMMVSARHLTYKHAVKALFEEARRLSPTVIFMEDIDLLGVKTRGDTDPFTMASAEKADILNEFLNAIDGAIDSKGLLVIGTSNRWKEIDPALLRSGRLGIHLYFGLPKFPERKQFFNKLGKKNVVWESTVTEEWLASESEGMSGADIVELIGLAKQYALREGVFQGGNLVIKKAHFDEAFKLMHHKIKDGSGSLLNQLRNYQEVLNFNVRKRFF